MSIVYTCLIVLYCFITIAFSFYTYHNERYIYKELIDMKDQINIFYLIFICIFLFPLVTPSQIIVFIFLIFQYLIECIYIMVFSIFPKSRYEVKKWHNDIKENRKWFFLNKKDRS